MKKIIGQSNQRESDSIFKLLIINGHENIQFWTLRAVILGKLIYLAVGRKRALQARRDQFVRDTQSLERMQKETGSFKMLEE